ncbi:MAG: citryl-CoA lyase [Vicinamibacterales bacterium]
MAKTSSTPDGQAAERRAQPRQADDNWRTALTAIEPNKILVRGYPLDEMMGRLSFGEAIYLLLQGELPTPAIGRLMEALLVSFIDHGATPPSTLASRNTATTGAPLRACVAAGVLGFGRYFGGDITACMQLLDEGLALCRSGKPIRDAAAQVLEPYLTSGETPPGFGHRFHSRDPRATRLFQMAMELELDGEHIRFIRALEFALQHAHESEEAGGHEPAASGQGPEARSQVSKTPPVNIDGAIAAVCSDLGLKPDVADALFVISRVPGIAAHALEERERNPPMRQIDPKDHVYDGPSERRLPETRRR